jgi:hypothetical protein
MNQDETKTLIARQIAVHEGRVWDRLDHKARAVLLTLAGCIIATTERRSQKSNRKSQ